MKTHTVSTERVLTRAEAEAELAWRKLEAESKLVRVTGRTLESLLGKLPVQSLLLVGGMAIRILAKGELLEVAIERGIVTSAMSDDWRKVRIVWHYSPDNSEFTPQANYRPADYRQQYVRLLAAEAEAEASTRAAALRTLARREAADKAADKTMVRQWRKVLAKA